MREVRPTIKALKSLPRSTFGNTAPLDLIANSDFERLNLYGVQHPLLDDARARFSSGLPDRHKAASKAYGKPVYEVRDRAGAGWRGAVALDEEGDPWLVWAERHDQFHRGVAKLAFANLMPTSAEYKLRAREEAAQAKREWEHSVLKALVEALRESVKSAAEVTTTVPGTAPGVTATLEVGTDHNEPSDDVAEAHDGVSMLTVGLRIATGGWGDFESALTRVCLPFLQPDPSQIETAFGRDGSLILYVEITHAQVIQLLADPPPYEAMVPVEVKPPDRLHYVGVDYMLDGYVHGIPLRGVCGTWFVATRSEACGLPVCEPCEAEQPAAQAVLDVLRSKQ